jgi:hypothetical protein
MNFSSFKFIMTLNTALPCWKMLVFISTLAVLENFLYLVFVPQLNIKPMLLTWWVNTLIYFNSNKFLSHIFYNHCYWFFPNNLIVYLYTLQFIMLLCFLRQGRNSNILIL